MTIFLRFAFFYVLPIVAFVLEPLCDQIPGRHDFRNRRLWEMITGLAVQAASGILSGQA